MGNTDELRDSLERLVALGKSPDVNIRPVLLRVVVDLFIRKAHHSPDDLAHFEEITQRLLDEADAGTRLSVAEKLSRHAEMPQALAQRFLAEGGAIAGCVLQHARLGTEALAGSSAWGCVEMAVAVARRADLDPVVCRTLAERPEPEILWALASNPAAPLDRSTVQYLVRRARDDSDLATLVLARDCQPADLAPLFLLADTSTRAAIVLAARRDDLGPESRRPRLSTDEMGALSRVERSLLNAEQDSFDVALAVALGLDLDAMSRLLDDPHGEPLAIGLAAIGASAEFAARVFILSGPAIGQSVMAVRRLTQLVETLPMRTASRLVAAMTQSAIKPQRRRRVAIDDAQRARRGDADTRASASETQPQRKAFSERRERSA